MKFHEAILEALRGNGPERTYACQRAGFGLGYEEVVFPDDFINGENWQRIRHLDDFEVVDSGGAAWILFRGIVAFRPRPTYESTRVGLLEPIILRFDPEKLLHQVAGVSGQFGVRLVAGRARSSPWRAHFVDHTGDPARDVHLERRIGRFPGKTLADAVWAAVRDIRSVCPRLPATT